MNQPEAPTAVLTPPAASTSPSLSLTASVPPALPVPPPPPTPPSIPSFARQIASEPQSWSLGNPWRALPSWLVSMVFHLTMVIVLMLSVSKIRHDGDQGSDISIASQGETTMALEGPQEVFSEPDTLDMPMAAEAIIEPLPASELLRPEEVEPPFADAPLVPAATAAFDATPSEVDTTSLRDEELLSAGEGIASLTLGDDPKDMLKGRLSEANRAALVKRDGGTTYSESAVGRALKWLANHQLADGSWSFNHQRSVKCGKKCGHPGNLDDAKIAATAMALLPFLGQGHTHKSGEYRSAVDRGLYFLTRSMRHSGPNGGLHEPGGRMYGHGLAAIVLCEAYGLTQDPSLKTPAQASINYIVMAQDPRGGGWRYNPQQPGDTSVVGWQLMALKSGHMAYLKVPEQTVAGASRFLDEVQDDYGSSYGYTGPGGGAATTSIGLLCRLYLAWKPSHDAIQRGVQQLQKMGPSIQNPDHAAGKHNMYYNYYATQVLHHVGGYPWEQWNAIMRDYLVKTQAMEGHETGSWYFEGGDQGSAQGGRLYCTSMAAMILEVYYRHLPLYRQQSVLDRFGQ